MNFESGFHPGSARAAIGLLVAALLSLASVVSANDFSYGGAGTNIVPRRETRVRMESEDILIAFERGFWWVEAKYVFANPTQNPLDLQMGFPESRCTGDSDCHIHPPFDDMKTSVRGRPVKHERGTVWLGSKYPELGRVWTYRVQFAPGERVEVLHTYRMEGSYNAGGGREFLYITRTGALWATPIAKARFRFWMPATLKAYGQSESLPKKRPQIVARNGSLVAEVVFEFSDWAPSHDIIVWFNESRQAFGPDTGTSAGTAGVLPRCPLGGGPIGGWEEALQAAELGPPALDDLARTWAGHGTPALFACRAYLLAQYGKRLHDDRLNRFFYGPDGFVPKGPPYFAFEPNPEFCESEMELEDRLLLQVLNQALRVARTNTR